MTTATSTPAAGTTKVQFNAPYVWTIATVAALGGLLFGWDWVVIGGAKPFFEPHFNLSLIATQWSEHGLARAVGLTTEAALSGWANSCALLGCLVGALLAGALSDKFGRKKLLIVSALRNSLAGSHGGFFLEALFCRRFPVAVL